MKRIALFLFLLPVVAYSATVYQVAPYGSNTSRTTWPYGTAPVGAECESDTIAQSATGRVKYHYLKGKVPPTAILAPCVPVTIPDPVPTPTPTPIPDPPTGAGMPNGIPAIGTWYSAPTVPVTGVQSGTESALALYDRTGMPELTGLTVSCSYCIVKGAKVKGSVRLSGNHIIFRDSEVYGHMPSGNGTVVQASGSDIVIERNHIHDNGRMDATEHDVHGVSASNGTKRVWILNNEIHHNSGDGVQVGHGHTPGATSNIYVGRNKMYADKENAVDFKIVSNTVISENVMTGYKSSPSSEGAAIVLHYCHVNADVLDNQISDSQVGVSVTSLLSICTTRPIETEIKGNTFTTIRGNAVQAWDTQIIHVDNNHFTGVGKAAVDLTNCKAESTVLGNTFANVGRQVVTSGASCKPTVN